ncbi:uncharacterized protein C8Q71DRAFT_735811 [Rhodofomes roseus]|uniref:Uncharacterized protein n=1 Tax=Rhodofomes roseus TaxID=34475 RepID=A0ABQ8KVK6_9APHY|nr:uncharacterized protein C8Q71DRAFT_735811 [Rhodofomes roseus]KAH9843090.1 hypothetical protein C8Q71DRAFT_735811 [Rhodofomes roseus]
MGSSVGRTLLCGLARVQARVVVVAKCSDGAPAEITQGLCADAPGDTDDSTSVSSKPGEYTDADTILSKLGEKDTARALRSLPRPPFTSLCATCCLCYIATLAIVLAAFCAPFTSLSLACPSPCPHPSSPYCNPSLIALNVRHVDCPRSPSVSPTPSIARSLASTISPAYRLVACSLSHCLSTMLCLTVVSPSPRLSVPSPVAQCI